MARPLLWLVLVPWTLQSARGGEVEPGPNIVLVEPSPKDGGLVVRASTLAAAQLESLGLRVAFAPASREGSYRLAVTPAETMDPAANLVVEWTQKSGAKLERGRTSGDAETFETLVAQLALEIAERSGKKASPTARVMMLRRQAPFAVHALLGAGQAHLTAGDPRRAYSRLEQAASQGDEFYPEAQSLALRAKIALANGQEARVLADRELATTALERARVARSRERHGEALDGYRAYLRYEHRVARPKSWVGMIDGKRHSVWKGEAQTLIETGSAEALLFDEASGELKPVPSRSPLAGLHEGDVLRVEPGPTLVRSGGPKGAPRFRLRLPAETSLGAGEHVPIVRGFAALVGGPKLAWVDLGLGTPSALFQGRVLASGDEGLLVLRTEAAPFRVGLFRPGRHQPSFELELAEIPKSASLTRGRVLIEVARGLLVHDSETGRLRAGPFKVGAGLVHLGSHGRYGAFGSADRRVLLLDVLAAEPLGTVTGPSKAVAAVGHDYGIALAFESGDVLFCDREGRAADRALVPGRPLALLAVGSMRPSLMAVTTEGIYFLAPPNADTPRDVDVFVELALVLEKAGKKEAALRVATHGAQLGVGRVGELEAMRASLLAAATDPAEVKAREAAAHRAQAARDLGVWLPRFSWGD